MKLPISVATKLLKMQQGETISAALLKHSIFDSLVDEGVLQKQRLTKARSLYLVNNKQGLQAYLNNHFGIADLALYVEQYNNLELTRGEAIDIASNSKIKQIRTFKGFLVNSYEPVMAVLNGESIIIHPTKGTYTFIYDFESFIVDESITIVGIENPENFRWVEKQQYLFKDIKPLFISRYPQTQTGDVIKWLKNIPNNYLHFGDFDFEGINIYLREYKKHLQNRATFLMPTNIEKVLQEKGNSQLYNNQLHHIPAAENIVEIGIHQLIALLRKYKKGLEQEAFIK